MRNRKYFALAGMAAVLAAITVCMNYFMEHAEGEEHLNSYTFSKTYGICINEVCSDYFPSSFAEENPSGDWIELYNFSDTGQNLGEYYLSDDKNDLHKYKLPKIELLPGNYYVIHSECDETAEGEECINFRINAQGETIYLSNDKEGVIDVIQVPGMETNTSWSRLADAGHEWGNTELTYRSSNNQARPIPEKTKEPVFSAEGGFYKDEFELELRAASESRIYYTLDGSDPDIGSILYEGPILVRDVSGEPNVYSARNDFSAEFYDLPDKLVEKIMVVRAIAIDKDGRKSDIITNSYIVGKENRKSYREMYTVSLVTDPYNLFDGEEGIYVLGEKYDGSIPAEGDGWHDADANYRVRGKRSERPASIEIFNKSGECIYDRKVGIRIHGNSTRSWIQKSFSVFMREMYDGKDIIEGLFGAGTSVHKFMLYSNTEGTKLNDALISRTLADRNMATQSIIYCNLFLDGEYWGIYLLEEVYDEYYFQNHYGIEADNIWLHEGATPPDVAEYLNAVSDKSESEVYETLCEMIDIQSFIDYYASMLYLNDRDWLDHNARCYRSIGKGLQENEDGKWRWGVWDVEATLRDAAQNTFQEEDAGYTFQEDIIVKALMEHESFKKQFVITYMDLYNSKWQDHIILPYVEEMANDIEESYAMYMERFRTGVAIDEYYNKLITFLSARKEYAFEHLRAEFSLDAEPVWLVLLPDKEGVSFRINTTAINISDTWWQGLYFQDYPVEIAVEGGYEGNEFLGWYSGDGELLSTDKTLVVDLAEETNIICPKFVTK